MGAGVVLRWTVAGLDCELVMRDGTGQLSMRARGEVVASVAVPSASAAYAWADERAQADLSGRRNERRTGSAS